MLKKYSVNYDKDLQKWFAGRPDRISSELVRTALNMPNEIQILLLQHHYLENIRNDAAIIWNAVIRNMDDFEAFQRVFLKANRMAVFAKKGKGFPPDNLSEIDLEISFYQAGAKNPCLKFDINLMEGHKNTLTIPFCTCMISDK